MRCLGTHEWLIEHTLVSHTLTYKHWGKCNEGQRCLETDDWSQQSLTPVADMKNILFSSNLSSRSDHLISLTDHFVYFCRFVFIVTTQIVIVLLW